jgi:hypothetical protein
MLYSAQMFIAEIWLDSLLSQMTLIHILIQLLRYWTLPTILFYLKHTKFWRLDSVSVFRWNLLSWAQSIELDDRIQSPKCCVI